MKIKPRIYRTPYRRLQVGVRTRRQSIPDLPKMVFLPDRADSFLGQYFHNQPLRDRLAYLLRAKRLINPVRKLGPRTKEKLLREVILMAKLLRDPPIELTAEYLLLDSCEFTYPELSSKCQPQFLLLRKMPFDESRFSIIAEIDFFPGSVGVGPMTRSFKKRQKWRRLQKPIDLRLPTETVTQILPLDTNLSHHHWVLHARYLPQAARELNSHITFMPVDFIQEGIVEWRKAFIVQ